VGIPHPERWKTVGRHPQADSNGTACTYHSPSPGLSRVFPSCPGDQGTTLVMHCRRGQTARRIASGFVEKSHSLIASLFGLAGAGRVAQRGVVWERRPAGRAQPGAGWAVGKPRPAPGSGALGPPHCRPRRPQGLQRL
jgi:hypothetical protein